MNRKLLYTGILTFGVGDVITTIYLAYTIGIHKEGNPLMRDLMFQYSPLSFIPIKIIGFCLIVAMANVLPKRQQKITLWIIILAGVFATGINGYVIIS